MPYFTCFLHCSLDNYIPQPLQHHIYAPVITPFFIYLPPHYSAVLIIAIIIAIIIYHQRPLFQCRRRLTIFTPFLSCPFSFTSSMPKPDAPRHGAPPPPQHKHCGGRRAMLRDGVRWQGTSSRARRADDFACRWRPRRDARLRITMAISDGPTATRRASSHAAMERHHPADFSRILPGVL